MKSFYGFLLVLMMASVAQAQTKISGSMQCSKPGLKHAIPVGDNLDHTLAVHQVKCTWAKPLQIMGLQSKDGVSTAFVEVTGNNSRTTGYHVTAMENGDGLFFRYQGTGTLKDGAAQSEEGKWGIRAGNGKLRGVRGQGIYKCTSNAEGAACDVSGEIQTGSQ